MPNDKPTPGSRKRKLRYDVTVKELTLSNAANHRLRWTADGKAMALDRSLTAKQAALKLRRSVKGVQKIRYMANDPSSATGREQPNA